jgi:hypothetical protein
MPFISLEGVFIKMSLTKFRKQHNPTLNDIVDVADRSGAKNSNTELCQKECLPLIKCECGTEILLLPDLKAMDRAINAHIAEHRKKGNNPSKAATSSRISQLLAQLSLRKASEYPQQ